MPAHDSWPTLDELVQEEEGLVLPSLTEDDAWAAIPVTKASGRPETARQKLIPPATEARKVLAIPNTGQLLVIAVVWQQWSCR